MVDVVEVFWNAKPTLERIGIKPERVGKDGRAERLFEEVRRAVMGAFPGLPTLVRIGIKTGDPDQDLRVMRAGQPSVEDVDGLRQVIDEAVDRVMAEAA